MTFIAYGSGRRARQNKGQPKTPKKANKQAHTGNRFSLPKQKEDPARERADIPPGGARSRLPRKRDRAADWAVAAAQSAVVRFTDTSKEVPVLRTPLEGFPFYGQDIKKGRKGRTDRVGRLQRRILPKGR